MARPKTPREPKKPKGITPEFENILNTSSEEGLKSLIVTMQKQLQEVVQFLKCEDDSEAAEELRRMRSAVAEIESPSKETKAVLMNRTKAVLKVLGERGQI
jgi:hypothetical protein